MGLTCADLCTVRVPFALYWNLAIQDGRQIFDDRSVEGIAVDQVVSPARLPIGRHIDASTDRVAITAPAVLSFRGEAKDSGGRVADAILYPYSEAGCKIRGW